MADKIPLKLELDLQKLAINAIAIKLWESPLARQKVREFFEEFRQYSLDLENFNSISDHVLQQLRDISLPGKLLVKIRDVIPFIGEKIFHWIRRAIFKLGLKLDHAEKMVWTCYGTVDEAKTFQLYWRNDPELLQTEKDFKHSLYTIACLFGQEEFVSRNLRVMKKLLRDFSGPRVKMPKIRDAHSMITCWLHRYFKERRELRNYKNLELTLLRICAEEGYLNAFKYFWNSLQKGGNINFLEDVEEVLSVIIEKYSNRLKDDIVELFNNNYYNYDNYIEILLIFLLGNMSWQNKSLFLGENADKLIFRLIDAWPYQELAVQLINFKLPFMAEFEYRQLLKSFTKYLTKNHGNRHTMFSNVASEVLEKTLELVPKQLKKEKLIDCSFLSTVIERNDFQTIRIIFNDPDLIDYKDEVIKLAEKVFVPSWYQRELDFDRVNDFMRIVLSKDEEKKFKSKFNNYLKSFVEGRDFEWSNKLLDWSANSTEEKRHLKKEIRSIFDFTVLKRLAEYENFKEADKIINWLAETNEEKFLVKKEIRSLYDFNIITELLKEENFKKAEKVIDWLAESNEEKVLLRKEIKPIEVLTYFHEHYIFSVSNWTKLLNWQFGVDEEQIKSAKIAFKTNDFIRNAFCKIWCDHCVSSVELSKTKCSEFLNFFFKPDEIEFYQREVIISDESFIKIFCGHLQLQENFDTVHELLKFCCVPRSKIKEIRGKILDEMEHWIMYFGKKEEKFEVAFALTNWVTDGKKNKGEIIGKFVNSSAGAELCWEMMDKWKIFGHEAILKLLNSWMKPYGDVPQIREFFFIMEMSKTRNKLVALLKKLEEKRLSENDYFCICGRPPIKLRI